MKRNHALVALGAAGLLAAAFLSAKPPKPSPQVPVYLPTPTVIIERVISIETPTLLVSLPSSTAQPTLVAFAPTQTLQPIDPATPTPDLAAAFPTAIAEVTLAPVEYAATETPLPTSAPALPPDTPAALAPTSSPTSPPPTPSPSPSATVIPVQLTEATLLRVIDGDTIEVAFDGRTERVRLIGVDSPETNGPPICFGEEASAYAQQLLAQSGGKMWLEKDVSETDKYGRLLRYVWLDAAQTRMFDELMVADGYAQHSTYPPDVKYEARFLEAERVARAESRGLWGACAYFGEPLPTTTPSPEPTAPPVPTSTLPSNEQRPNPQGGDDLPYDPNGPDRDCSDFATHDEAQRFFIAAGGPENDPHRLDADHDGIACESLP